MEEEEATALAGLAEVAQPGRRHLVVQRAQQHIAQEHLARQHQAVFIDGVVMVGHPGAWLELHQHRHHLPVAAQRLDLDARAGWRPGPAASGQLQRLAAGQLPPERLQRRQLAAAEPAAHKQRGRCRCLHAGGGLAGLAHQVGQRAQDGGVGAGAAVQATLHHQHFLRLGVGGCRKPGAGLQLHQFSPQATRCTQRPAAHAGRQRLPAALLTAHGVVAAVPPGTVGHARQQLLVQGRTAAGRQFGLQCPLQQRHAVGGRCGWVQVVWGVSHRAGVLWKLAGCHGFRAPASRAAGPAGASVLRSAASARRRWDLTVPKGRPVWSATSCWVRPRK